MALVAVGFLVACDGTRTITVALRTNSYAVVTYRGEKPAEIQLMDPDPSKRIRVLITQQPKGVRTVLFYDSAGKQLQETILERYKESVSSSFFVSYTSRSSQTGSARCNQRTWTEDGTKRILYQETEIYDDAGKLITRSFRGPDGIPLE